MWELQDVVFATAEGYCNHLTCGTTTSNKGVDVADV